MYIFFSRFQILHNKDYSEGTIFNSQMSRLCAITLKKIYKSSQTLLNMKHLPLISCLRASEIMFIIPWYDVYVIP